MRKGFVRSLVVIFLCGFAASNLFGGGLKSEIIAAGQQKEIDVPQGIFLKIRNFTQEGGTDRGVVMVTINNQTTNVLAATRIDIGGTTSMPTGPMPTPTPTPTPSPSPTPTPSPEPTSSALEPMNSVIIVGPATVTIQAASDAAAFITYKKDKDSD